MSHSHAPSDRSIKSLAPLFIAAMLFLGACAQEQSPMPPPNDSWYRPVDKVTHKFFPLPPFLYSPVKQALIAEAVAAMGDCPLLQLSTSEALRYADDRLRTMRELRPFLIHGLYRTKRIFNIAIADRALWVDSIDDAFDTAPIRRQPIVLYMDEVPPDVYVTTGWQMAEDVAAAGSADDKK